MNSEAPTVNPQLRQKLDKLLATMEFNGTLLQEEDPPDDTPAVSKQDAVHGNRDEVLFGPRFCKADFDNYQVYAGVKQQRILTLCRTYADHIKELRSKNVNSLFMAGGSGTGKNHLAYAIGRQVVRAGYSIEVTSFLNIMREIKSSWNRRAGESEKEIIDRYQRAQFLILEELGVSYGSETEQINLFEIVDGRYKRQLPTIYTTNMNHEEFRAFADFDGKDRIWDRLVETCAILVFDWQSYRELSRKRGQGNAEVSHARADHQGVA